MRKKNIFLMKINNFDTTSKVFIIAEIGNNHEGDLQLAKELIDRAIDSGADAVKFQTIVPELFVSTKEKERVARLKKFQFTTDQFFELSNYSKEREIIFFSTPFDLVSAEFLNTIQPVFKIASGDNNFFPLIDKVSSFGKPMIISTGLSNYKRIDCINNGNKRKRRNKTKSKASIKAFSAMDDFSKLPDDIYVKAFYILMAGFSLYVFYRFMKRVSGSRS